MANTRKTLLDSLVTQLQGLSPKVKTVTRFMERPDARLKNTPYITLVAGTEVPEVEDTTANKIRYRLPVHLLVDTEQNTQDIEDLVDAIKDLIYSPIDLGSNVLYVKIDPVDVTVLQNTENVDRYSYTTINLIILYWSARGAA